MTAHRDARGRFVNPKVAAANLALEEAVREAVRLIRGGDTETVHDHSGRVVFTFRCYDAGYVRTMLTAAGRTAALLLGEAS